MKTIEERAFDIAKEFGSTKSNKVRAIYRACVRMAIEQQKIDFEQTREWLQDNLEIPEDGVISEEDGKKLFGDKPITFFEEFMKAMEKQI